VERASETILSMTTEEATVPSARTLAPLDEALRLAGGISDSTRRRILDFPRPVVLSRTRSGRPCRIAFVREEVAAWCESRIAAARASGPEAT
jgi:hypothetical protein